MDYSKFKKWEDGSYASLQRMLDRLDLAQRKPGESDVDGHERTLANTALVPEMVMSRDPFYGQGNGQQQQQHQNQNFGGGMI